MPDLLAEAAYAARREQARTRRRRAAAPHPARADRGARRCWRPASRRRSAWRARWAAELGWDEAAPRARGRALPRRGRRGGIWWSAPELPSGPRRNFRASAPVAPTGPIPSLELVVPHVRRLALPVLIALLGARRAARRRPAALVPGRRQPADRRPERRHRPGRRRRPGPRRHRRRRLPQEGRRRPHVFVSRFNGGAFRAPERVDNGIGGGASDAAIAAADADRLAVAWTAGSHVYGSVVAGQRRRAGAAARPDRRSSATRRRTAIRRSTWASTAPPTRPGRRRAAAAPTSARRGCRTPRGRDRRAARRRSGARRRPRRAALARGGLRPRATRSSTWGEDNADGRRASGRAA